MCSLQVDKEPAEPGEVVLEVEDLTCAHRTLHKNNAVQERQLSRCAPARSSVIAGIDGNGQTELVYGLTGLEKLNGGTRDARRQGHHPRHASASARSTA